MILHLLSSYTLIPVYVFFFSNTGICVTSVQLLIFWDNFLKRNVNIKAETKDKIKVLYPIHSTLSSWTAEYVNCTSAEGVRPSPTSILGRIMNCILWWGSSHGPLGNMKYPLIAITPRFWLRLVVPVRVSTKGQIEMFNYLQRIIISYMK